MSFIDWIRSKEDTQKLILGLQDEIGYWQSYANSKVEWSNPENWNKYVGNYQIITGLQFPANTCIIINDRTIKQQAVRLLGNDIKETADNVEKWVYDYVVYYSDDRNNFHLGFIEWWQQASMTFAEKKGDCDDKALLFHSIMHVLGYGDKIVTCAGTCKFPGQGDVGHAFNKVKIGQNWIVYDATNQPVKNQITYPEFKDMWFWCNYWDVYSFS